MRFDRLLPPRIKDFFDSRFVVLFAIGATVVAFGANALYDFFKGIFKLQAFDLRYLILFALAGLSLLGGAWFLKASIGASYKTSSEKKPASPRGALIVLASSPEVVKKAIEHHLSKLRVAWVLMSKETAHWTETLARQYTNNDRSVTTRQLSNPADWREVAELVQGILTDLPADIQPKDVVVDFTGMPKPASVGATLAALHMGASLQWIPQTTTVNADGTKSLKAGDPEEQDIDYHVFPPSSRPATLVAARSAEGR